MLTYFNNSKLSFAQGLAEIIPALNVIDSLELSVVCGMSNLFPWTISASITTPWRQLMGPRWREVAPSRLSLVIF